MNNKKYFISLIKKYTAKEVEFGKDINYLCFRNNCTKKDFINDIFSSKNLKIVIKQKRDNEERFLAYYIYSKRKGRAYVLRFYKSRIRVITIYPLGNKTLNKYRKRKFKSNKTL